MTAKFPPPEEVLGALGVSALLFLAFLCGLWAIERFILRRWCPTLSCANVRPLNGAFFQDVIVWTLPIAGATLLLSLLCEKLGTWFGLDLPRQDLVLILQHGNYSISVQAVICAFAVLEAPLLEEGIFRRFIFRDLLGIKGMKPVTAMLISGILFALAHHNAVTFIPLAFFGAALAWVYYRTGRLLAPMLIHALFNLINLLLLFALPESV